MCFRANDENVGHDGNHTSRIGVRAMLWNQYSWMSTDSCCTPDASIKPDQLGNSFTP